MLPICLTKEQLWREYSVSSTTGQRVVQLTSFRLLWHQLVPHVVIGKPRSDLCWVCQRNNMHILRAVNIPEAMKSATLLRQDQDVREATTEWTTYQAACAYAKTFAEELGISELGRSDNPPASFHYSFDTTQQMHYLANPLQPGSVIFKTPRKMQPIGFHAEGISRQRTIS